MHCQFPDELWHILRCPGCRNTLDKQDDGAVCRSCQATYGFTDSGALDLRLKVPKKIEYEFELMTSLPEYSDFDFNVLPENPSPEVVFSKDNIPFHLSKEMISYFPKAKNDDSLMLDLGCGNSIHREVCEQAGFKYIGMDDDSEEAGILADAHCLPFCDGSFEFILSVAVLEHIRLPFIMMKEANRVLKPGGKLIGTVAFLEPFHGNSYYHHTHIGTYNSLKEGGFEIEHIAPSDKWSVLIAQASMVLFPKMPSFLSTLLVSPLQYLHKLWWYIGSKINNKASKEMRILNTTGAFTFIARKKSEP